jgi:hypothetical protein
MAAHHRFLPGVGCEQERGDFVVWIGREKMVTEEGVAAGPEIGRERVVAQEDVAVEVDQKKMVAQEGVVALRVRRS